MALERATKQAIDKVHDSSLTLLLASEEAAHRLTRQVVASNTERLVASVALQLDSKAAAHQAAARAIREGQEALQEQFERAMLEARAIGQEFAARQLALEAEPLIQTASHGLVLTPSLAPAEVETMWAQHAATGMARQFGASAIGETQLWLSNPRLGPAALPRALARVALRSEPERKKHAVTQAVGNYNEAKRRGWEELRDRARAKPLKEALGLKEESGGKNGRGGADAGWFEIWSAMLDTKTCPICWKLDGEMVKPGQAFPDGATTPRHGHCRCDILRVYIPAELERYLPGAGDDYEALKDDIKDYMGSRKFDVGEGVRHAKSFVDDVFAKRYPGQGEKSPMAGSAWVLTGRVNDRKAYFPNVPRATAPSLRR